ncbi:LysR family transcriptional regulator [Variovorax sp. LjRoot175]|uniref:LysR family transcriptional regulator n=2 Tax=unclassified Variovorax TaxID=663243 RepID=UPI003F51925E
MVGLDVLELAAGARPAIGDVDRHSLGRQIRYGYASSRVARPRDHRFQGRANRPRSPSRSRILRRCASSLSPGSRVRCAERESTVPSAVSKRMAALEVRAGMPLLRRGARGMEPTDAGLALARQAREVLASLERMRTTCYAGIEQRHDMFHHLCRRGFFQADLDGAMFLQHLDHISWK